MKFNITINIIAIPVRLIWVIVRKAKFDDNPDLDRWNILATLQRFMMIGIDLTVINIFLTLGSSLSPPPG